MARAPHPHPNPNPHRDQGGGARIRVREAPEPSDVFWANLELSELERACWALANTTILLFLASVSATALITAAFYADSAKQQLGREREQASPVEGRAPRPLQHRRDEGVARSRGEAASNARAEHTKRNATRTERQDYANTALASNSRNVKPVPTLVACVAESRAGIFCGPGAECVACGCSWHPKPEGHLAHWHTRSR